MDHGFAPGVTDFDLQYLNLLRNRKTAAFDTQAWPDPNNPATGLLGTVAELWMHLLLKTTGPGARPIGDVVLVSHGNETGSMVIKIQRSPAAKTDYDELRRIQADGLAMLETQLPQNLRKTPPNGPLKAIKIHIRGCRIGDDSKFMNRLKVVFGNTVTAPKHIAGVFAIFDGKRPKVDPPSHGFAECLMYDFEIKSKTRFTDRAKLVKAFKDAKHKFIDGVQVPDALWDAWIPKTQFNAALASVDMPFLALGTTITPTSSGSGLPNVKMVGPQGVFEHNPFTETVTAILAAKPKPADHRKIILDVLRAQDSYSRADHPFHESLGFATLENYVDQFTWAPTWSERDKAQKFVGTYHYYNVQIPLCDPTVGTKTDPKTWQLLYNFYPLRTLPLVAVEKLSVADGRLFVTATP